MIDSQIIGVSTVVGAKEGNWVIATALGAVAMALLSYGNALI